MESRPETPIEAFIRGKEEGLKEGKISAMEAILARVHERLDEHNRRLTSQEKVSYGLLGIVAFVQILPLLSNIFEK